jgi:hypothetical protein
MRGVHCVAMQRCKHCKTGHTNTRSLHAFR